MCEDYTAKTIIGGGVTIMGVVFDLFATPLELVALLLFAMLADLVAGVLYSYKKDIPIQSLGLRQFGVKMIEYALVVMLASGLSNAFGGADIDNWVGNMVGALSNIDYFCYLYLIMTEFKSIAENIEGTPLEGFFDKINEKMNKSG